MKDKLKVVIRPEVFKKSKTKVLSFESRGGVHVVDGSPEWPHMLLIRMDRSDVAGVINGLVAQLADTSNKIFHYSFMGELRED